MSATARSSRQLLDAAQTLAQIEGLDVAGYLARLRDELAPVQTLAELERRDDEVRGAIAAIEAFASKAMRVRLATALAADTTLGPPFRKLIATTIVRYANAHELLRERVLDAASRADPHAAPALADAVVAAAREVLDQRARLVDGVLGIARDLASATIPDAHRAARDTASPDPIRHRWSAARRDLEAVVERPDHVLAGTFAERVAGLPPLLDAPEPVRELSFGELLELD